MKTYLKKIQAGFLAALLLLSAVSFELPLSAAAQVGSVIFEDDFEDKTDWESFAFSTQKWESFNGGVIKALKDEDTGNVYANIYSGAMGSLNKTFDAPLGGTVDLDFDMALEFKSGDGLYIFPSPSTPSAASLPRIVEFDYQTNGVVKFKDQYGRFSSVTLEPGLWVKTSFTFDTENNKFSMWITKPGEDRQAVFENLDCQLKDSFYGFCFFYPGRGDGMGAIKLDNIKMSQLVLNTGIDEDFDSYTNVSELPPDWTAGENVSVSKGELHMSGAAKVQNVHKPYNVDSLALNGDIRYPSNIADDDIITLSVMSGDSVIDILNVCGNGTINGQSSDALVQGQNFHFDIVINNGDYTVNIDGVPTAEGVFSDNISNGISGIVIQTSGNADWSIDNLKSMPALTPDQMNELREDLNAIEIEEPTPGSTMILPSVGMNGSDITWKCSPESVIDVQTGTVNFPDWELGPTDVVLTCKVTKYDMSLSKNFTYHMEPAINNLFQNGDFEQVDENGIPTGWFSTSGRALQSSDNAQHGNRSALVSGRGDSTHSGAQYISLKPNRSYHFSGYVKLADEVVEGQDGRISVWLQGGRVNSTAGELTNYVTSFNAFYMNTNDWININSDFNTNINPPEWPNTAYIYPFPVGSTTLSFYMDNFEIYEYVLKSLNIRGDDTIAAPQSGETVKTFRAEAINQYGSSTGMENLEFEWSFDKPVNGITVNDKGEVSVSEYAENQTVQLICKAKEGTVAGSTWIFGTKSVSVTNSASEAPRAYDLSVSGEVKQGETLKAGYEYFQKNGAQEGNSVIQWYMSDSYDGGYQEISGQNSNELYIDEVLAEKFIRFSVTPKTTTGIAGTAVNSPSVTKNREPIAVDVSIKGNAVAGEKISGSYSFIDYNGDEEGDSKYSWLIGDNENGNDFTVIEGANGKELTVTEDFEDKYIRFEVIPVSKTAPENGKAVQSASLIGPTKPEIKEVKISGRTSVGNVLSVDYTYYDKNNDAENNSIIKWYSGNTLLQESATYIPTTADQGKQITAEVTPVSEKYPYNGIPVRSSAVTIAGGGGNNYTVSGGGSGGGRKDTTLPPVSKPSEPVIEHITDKTDSVLLSDIKGHWAESDITALAELGILKGKSENLFAPEDAITRAEFLTCIMRSLKAESLTYNGAFEDISSGDWYADTIQTALDCGIISQAKQFNPNAFITREEIAKMVAQAYTFMMNGQWPLDYDISSFSDHEQISDWATGYMTGCFTLGLLQGYDDGTINASANATRAQAAVIINRLIHLIY